MCGMKKAQQEIKDKGIRDTLQELGFDVVGLTNNIKEATINRIYDFRVGYRIAKDDSVVACQLHFGADDSPDKVRLMKYDTVLLPNMDYGKVHINGVAIKPLEALMKATDYTDVFANNFDVSKTVEQQINTINKDLLKLSREESDAAKLAVTYLCLRYRPMWAAEPFQYVGGEIPIPAHLMHTVHVDKGERLTVNEAFQLLVAKNERLLHPEAMQKVSMKNSIKPQQNRDTGLFI
jgi:hypothetical protein